MKNFLRSRQVHLDFHTSGDITGIADDFDAEAFADTMLGASVNSATVFARCHHGYIYYPSKLFPELTHPHLKNKNLLLEQVDALHSRGIKAPIYNTVQWDYYTALRHPEWLIRERDGSHEGSPFTEPGFYQSICLNSGYWDFLSAQTKELIEILGGEPDGFFFDIVNIRPCWCNTCLKMMEKSGIDTNDDAAVRFFACTTVNRFRERMTRLVRDYSKDCTIFYNAGHVGPCTEASAETYSHFELESLPSGVWGYLHFPAAARYARTLDKDCLGMTGKFHLAWGDFHSLKNTAALEFECFRMLSYGMAVSVGDQLEPGGVLNPATYKLIGNVYKQIERYEEFARPSVPLVEAALVTSEREEYGFGTTETVLGATQMLEELSLQFDIIGTNVNLSKYKLIILPDDFNGDYEFGKRLDEYVENGGSVIACFGGGSSPAGGYPSCFGIAPMLLNENYPDFVLADGPLAEGLESGNEYVIYKQGVKIIPLGAETVLSARAPYFPRRGNKFCSHMYTPSAKGEPYAAAVKNGRVIFFGHPLFGQYRENAPLWCKKLIGNAINALLPERILTHDGPSTLSVQVLDQPEKNRAAAHVLSYIPVRKSRNIDIVEERTIVRGVCFKFNIGKEIKSARIAPDGPELAVKDGAVAVPEINGYAVIELGY